MKKFIPLLFLFFMSALIFAQDEELKEKQQNLNNSINHTWDANKKLSENNFIEAEVDYRKAIAKSPDNAAAPYNLGNAYYNNATFSEAFGRFKEAGETATNKKDKHKAYHNMGNVFMKRKDYAKAVEAYKEALRNNPKDEETRYNLALAKELLKKDEDKKDKNDENKDDKKDKDENKEGDNKDKKDQDKKDEGDEGDKGDKGDEQKDENKEGDGDKKEEQKKKPEQGDQPKEQQQPRPNQLSKQQIENLLRAMQNAEKKVQDKIDAKKVKGAKIKNEKDW
ncbi:tetratricopeptide repeat protein [Maribacter sp. MJ134]|uniref:tetratricopeptide repeat protein n=1 Tax=Maribacter sp. MJ134 TaxID=2496865 RepID=UPI000F833B7C|nr:tetratricopeptide repeat protein [Maribacter sp. MJ134]AZQ59946.1 tetratricopeptide repeat protein [Maribacter sp. MJ134]